MIKLPIGTWIRNAAAVLCKRRGAVSEQAAEAGCSRQTVCAHGRQLPQRLAENDQRIDELRQEIRQLAVEALRQACVQWWWLRQQQPASDRAASASNPLQELLNDRIRHGPSQLTEQTAYQRVTAIMRTTVRASSAVEGINSVRRMQQGRHRKMTQGLLNLKRLYWNCRPLQTSQRRGMCPFQLLKVPMPTTDFWTLLQMPKATLQERAQQLSAQRLPE